MPDITDGVRHVTRAAVLRHLNALLAKDTAARLADEITEDVIKSITMTLLAAELPPRSASQSSRSVRRNSVTKEHLEAVAEHYSQAFTAGVPPTKAVAEHFDASHSTAARWVGMARKEGYLGTVGPGRSGGGLLGVVATARATG